MDGDHRRVAEERVSMQRIPIDFRQLLERILPLEALSPSERDRLREDLAHFYC